MAAPDVIVVGGGVIGAAVTYFLSSAGVRVTLLEREELASQASGAAAGMLAPICESSGEGPFFQAAVRSLGMFEQLVPALKEGGGVDPQFVRSGVLRVALDPSDAEHLQQSVNRLHPYDVAWLSPAEAREREPQITPGLEGALWSPREGHVYSPAMTRSFAQAAAAQGARIETGIPVQGLLRSGDRVTGVVTAEGDRPAGTVVLCAGVWTRFCAEWLSLRLPLEPIRGQILALDAPRPSFRSIVWGEGAYLVPKQNGSVIVGATEERAGFDRRVTAAGLSRLLQAAPELVPALAQSTFRQAWAGLRPDTPDHLPVIGPVPGVEGLLLAAGHYRNGVLLSPITGRLIADWLLGTEMQAEARAFLPSRLLSH